MSNAKEDSSSQIATLLTALNKRFDVLESQVQKSTSQGVHSVHATPIVCDQCHDVHMPNYCPLYMAFESSTTWASSKILKATLIHKPTIVLGELTQISRGVKLPIKEEESKTDKMLARILSEVESSRVETKATFSLHETAIKNLEVQMGQLASQVNVMARSNLPSDTIPNPKRVGKEECNAINLRSGKVLPDVPSSSTPQPKQDDQVIDDVEEESVGRKMKLTRESNLKKV
ncbi:hypothetical protein K1719_041344 [Acacia pycnantha]|nr:hypothetical protein K1719_041344 [Acacia pycnantha]